MRSFNRLALAEQIGPATEAVLSAPPADTIMTDASATSSVSNLASLPLAAEGASGASAAAPAASSTSGEAAAFCETAAMFVSQAARNGDGPFLGETLARLLPSLLRLQDTPDPDFNHVIAHATTSLKYVELPEGALSAAMRALLGALELPTWRSRLAALAFAQAFAFRHAFLFADEDAAALREAVAARLADPKLEARFCPLFPLLLLFSFRCPSV